MRNLFILSLGLFIVFSLACSKKKIAKAECIGEATEDCICIQQYAPVCGCNGETYSNSCYADCAGVLHYTEGKCK